MKKYLIIFLFIANGLLIFKIFHKDQDNDFQSENGLSKSHYLSVEDDANVYFIQSVQKKTEFCIFEETQIRKYDKVKKTIEVLYDPSEDITLVSKRNLSPDIVSIVTREKKNYCLEYPGFSKIVKIPEGNFYEGRGKFALLSEIHSTLFIFSADFKEVVFSFMIPDREMLDMEFQAYSTATFLTNDRQAKKSCVEFWDLYSRLKMSEKCFENRGGEYKKLLLKNGEMFVTTNDRGNSVSVDDL